jgi:hypothetical protein
MQRCAADSADSLDESRMRRYIGSVRQSGESTRNVKHHDLEMGPTHQPTLMGRIAVGKRRSFLAPQSICRQTQSHIEKGGLL